MFAMLMAFCLDASFWYGYVKHEYRSFALKVAFVRSWVFKLFPVGMCLTLPLSEDYLFPWGDYLYEAPFTAAFASMIVSVSIVAVYSLTKILGAPASRRVTLANMLRHTSVRFELFLYFAGTVKLLYWLSITALANPLFYFLRVLESSLAFVPFFVGLSALTFKRATWFWIGVFAFHLFASFLTGTRGAAFIPIGLFLIGFAIQLPSWRIRIRWGIILTPVFVFLIVSGVFIGAVRDVVGRTDLATAIKEGSILTALTETTVQSQIDYSGGIAYKAFRRLSSWTTIVVPVMTPDEVPYRGFSDFFYEVRSAFGLGIFALINPSWQGNYYFGNLFLQQYGFAVHVDAAGFKTSNVELPVQVDAFMRGGWIAAFVFTIFAYLVIYALERILRRRLLPVKQPLFLILLCVLCYLSALRLFKASLVDSMRQVFLEGAFCFVVFYMFDRVLNWMGKTR